MQVVTVPAKIRTIRRLRALCSGRSNRAGYLAGTICTKTIENKSDLCHYPSDLWMPELFLLLVAVFPETLLAFVRRHFMALPFLS